MDRQQHKQKHFGDVVLRRSMSKITHRTRRRISVSRGVLFSVAVIFLVGGVSFLSFSLFGGAQTVAFHSSSCLGDWERAENAEGEPQTRNGEPFTLDNTAVAQSAGLDLFCGEFGGEVPEGEEVRRASVRLALFVGDERELKEASTSGGETKTEMSGGEENEEIVGGVATTTQPVSTTSPEASGESDETGEGVSEESAGEDSESATIRGTEEEGGQVVENNEEQTESGDDDEVIDGADGTETHTQEPQAEEPPAEQDKEPIREEASEEAVQEDEDPTAFFHIQDIGKKLVRPLRALAQEVSTSADNDDATEMSATGTTEHIAQDESVFVSVFYMVPGQQWEKLGEVQAKDIFDGVATLSLPQLFWEDLGGIQLKVTSGDGVKDGANVFLDAVWIEVDHEEEIPNTLPMAQEQSGASTTPGVVITPRRDFSAHEDVEFELELPPMATTSSQQTSTGTAVDKETEALGATTTNTTNTAAEEVESVNTTTPSTETSKKQTDDDSATVAEDTTTAGTTTSEATPTATTTPPAPPNDAGTTTEETKQSGSVEEKTSAFFSRLVPKLFAQGTTTESQEGAHVAGITVIDPDGGIADVVPRVREAGNTIRLIIPKPGRSFRPGKYSVVANIIRGDSVFHVEEEFTWGVLAINFNKHAFVVGEEAYIQMAALSDNGNTICNADLTLSVTDPTGAVEMFSTSGETIFSSETCGNNNVTDVPDYSLRYTTDNTTEGVYELTLTNNETGHSIRDSFETVGFVPFSVERTAATRINPFKSVYTMRMVVTARETFEGTIVDRLPGAFEVISSNADKIQVVGDERVIVWERSLLEEEGIILEYTYQAPKISPSVFLLGPLTLVEKQSVLRRVLNAEEPPVFKETRQWQLASDATGNMILLLIGSVSVPSGWSCVSCSGGQDFNARFARGSTTYSAGAGGSADHSHTVTSGDAGASGSTEGKNKGGPTNDMAEAVHTHTFTASVTTEANEPKHNEIRFIRADTAGEVDIPVDAMAVFDDTVPSGYARRSFNDGNYLKGGSTETGAGATSNTHTHNVTGSTGLSGVQTIANGSGVTASADHTHAVSSTTQDVSLEPPFVEVILGRKQTSSAAPPDGLIAMWDNTPPSGWNNVTALNGKFIKGAASYGSTGGGETHNHADMTGIVTGGASAGISASSGSDSNPSTHTHSVDVTNFSTENHVPPYTDVIFAKKTAADPTPLITSLTLNSGNDITLTESTFKWATATMLVTDSDGCTDISSVTAKLYRTATATEGTTCTYDGNSCYTSSCVATTTGNICGASDNDVEYDCGFDLWYIADPTDAGSFAGDIWAVAATSSDGTNQDTATNTGETIEVLTLLAHSVTSSVAYGTVDVEADTGAVNQTTVVTVTGNAALDTQIGCDIMCTDYNTCGGGVLAFSQQKYSLSGFTYSSGGTACAATATPATLETVLAKPTATTTNNTDDILWGIGIPLGQLPGDYTGENTLDAVAD